MCSGSLSCWITQLCSRFNRLTVDFCGKVEEFGGSHAPSLFRPLCNAPLPLPPKQARPCWQLQISVGLEGVNFGAGPFGHTLSVHVDLKPTSLYTVMLDNQQFSVHGRLELLWFLNVVIKFLSSEGECLGDSE